MKKLLNIGSMKLPKESATKGFGFIGKRGSGKSYGAAVFAEELFDASIPFVVFDPIDVWWGLKVAADGKGKGLPIVVFGKEHADIQLDRTMGKRIAEAVVKDNISCIISTFGMNKTEMREVVADFSERLLQINNTPRQVLIEEAHEYVPQRVGGAMARCFAAVEALLVMGRNRGIGVTLLNQRMATLNKDLLTQIDVLVAFRSVGPQDRKAFKDWVQVHGIDINDNDVVLMGDRLKFDEFMRSVPSLPTGEAWIWSPEFLEKFEKVKFRKRETFHPDREKLGMTFKMPEIKQGDVQSFIDSFSKKPERIIVNAPRAAGKVSGYVASRVDKQQLDAEYKRGYQEGVKSMEVVVGTIENGYENVVKGLSEYIDAIFEQLQAFTLTQREFYKQKPAIKSGVKYAPEKVGRAPIKQKPPTHIFTPKELVSSVEHFLLDGETSKPEQEIIDAIAWLHAIGLEQPNKNAVALVAKKRPTSGGYANNLSKLRSKGLVDYLTAGTVSLTETGKSIANYPKTIGHTNEEFHEIILKALSNPEANVLRPLLSGQEMSKEELADLTPYRITSGGYMNILSTLRTLGLIDYPSGGRVKATEIMFPFL